ncbi:ER-derived vesicles protein erv29 [Saitoella coloradoensis]
MSFRGAPANPYIQQHYANQSPMHQSNVNPYAARMVGSEGLAGEGNEFVDAIRKQTTKVEAVLESVGNVIKPYLGPLSRFLIISTFLEDALRITTQFSDQLAYLQQYRHFPRGLSHLFLMLNVIVMVGASGAVVAKKRVEWAVGGLLGVVVGQAVGYGLIFDLSFFLRNLSVMGGLLMVVSASLTEKQKHSTRSLFTPLTTLTDPSHARTTYFTLAGRTLLIFLFLSFIYGSQSPWSIFRILWTFVGFVACLMVVVGFKAKVSATVLVMILSVGNVLINNWWSVHSAHPNRDFLKYDFFQTLSIMGGFLLLVNVGPGGLSVDEKKKVY